MKVLFDHNVPRKLRHSLPEHGVQTADELGWAQLTNGELLSAAEGSDFDLLVTCDKNLSYQQNLTGRRIAIIVLSTNDWKVVRQGATAIREVVNDARAGSFRFLSLNS